MDNLAYIPWWAVQTAILKNAFCGVGQEAQRMSSWNQGGWWPNKSLGTNGLMHGIAMRCYTQGQQTMNVANCVQSRKIPKPGQRVVDAIRQPTTSDKLPHTQGELRST